MEENLEILLQQLSEVMNITVEEVRDRFCNTFATDPEIEQALEKLESIKGE